MSSFTVACVVLAISVLLSFDAIHSVQEGHVGVYFRGGALITKINKPGWHLKIPLLDRVENVQTTLQTDKVVNIPVSLDIKYGKHLNPSLITQQCGTSGGVMLKIEAVEVVNRLKEDHVYMTIKNYTVHYDKIWIFDKIHHEINQFCSKHTLQEVYIDLFHTVDDRLQSALQESCDAWAPGIEIIAIRITKPRIPDSILRNYEQMEAEKTKLLVAVQTQKVVEKEAETEKRRATIGEFEIQLITDTSTEAEKQAAVSKINIEQKVMEKEGQVRVKKLEDDAFLAHEKALADARYYAALKAAESNKLLYSEEYLRLQAISAVTNNTKIYFGPSIQSMYTEFFDLALKGKISSSKPTPASE
ncbi:putative SPFH domain-containing protein 2 precursor [Planoprotostelium fungivorum]|uniref:Putative SPFH domain-containing protein 2 n=1 Tax=Planoprotostelium fungivorum TaxID=1890364 RepID=A0A2P6NGB1_9EUKA|nr:putative SPFH domain-containing protein 2 precursor [Planoprotostelium fungivorum]